MHIQIVLISTYVYINIKINKYIYICIYMWCFFSRGFKRHAKGKMKQWHLSNLYIQGRYLGVFGDCSSAR